MTSHSVGDWTFEPEFNELRRGEERRRLEHRAARTLELLCSRPGEMVTPEDVIAQVWNGRAISPNSVPVVISDLRQALEDDARQPRYIETVAKRGYRLVVKPTEAFVRRSWSWRHPQAIAVAVLVLMLAAAVAWVAVQRAENPVVLVVSPVQNATGNPAYQPLVNASSALLVAEAEQLSGVQVYQGSSPRHDAIKLDSWLFIWNGHPTVMMSAHRVGGPVLWTQVTAGGERRIPQDIAYGMRLLGERLKQQKGHCQSNCTHRQ
jgi:DNA-binding winged helix-turn-helix (wHTH) protein